MVTFDVALRARRRGLAERARGDLDQLLERYFGHFFATSCTRTTGEEGRGRGAQEADDAAAGGPRRRRAGRAQLRPLYPALEALVAHYRELDPLNMFNAGVGETSAKKGWG